VASSVFRQPLGEVARGVIPFIGLMLIGLMAVTYVPTISLGLVNKVMREKDFYEPFPDPPGAPGSADDPDSDADVEGDLGGGEPVIGPGGERVMSVAEMMAAAETEGEDEDEDEDDTAETEDDPKPAFDGKGMNMIPVDPDEEDEDDEDEDIKPVFDGQGMNMVPATPDDE
jgi:C4-dicarboxylate transporter DctM subunit